MVLSTAGANYMINESTMLVDSCSDDVLAIIESMKSFDSWTQNKREVADKLIELLTIKGYIFFSATNMKRYLISTVGTSYLYDVPLYKQGHLAQFRGQRVRIVCTHSGRFTWRGFMVNSVGVTPPGKVIEKLPRPELRYTFPHYVSDHESLYKSPRYVVLRINKKLKILSHDASNGYINTNGWDVLLVDGKAGGPIATLKLNDDGSVRGKLIRYGGGRQFESLRKAIDHLSKRHHTL